MKIRMRTLLQFLLFAAAISFSALAQGKLPAITLDEFMSTTEIHELKLSPDGTAALIGTEAPDWKTSTFRYDLWIWTAANGLRPLTHSGSETSFEWSPDGKWIAFLSDRAPSTPDEGADGAEGGDAAEAASRIWIIPANGGEALPLFQEPLDVHAFAWAPDGSAIYYAVSQPMTPEALAEHKEQWKDVIRWREHLKGDLILRQPLAESLAAALATPLPHASEAKEKKEEKKPKEEKKNSKEQKELAKAEEEAQIPALAKWIAYTPLSIAELAPSPDGKLIAFTTEPAHHRVENPAEFEIYLATTAEQSSSSPKPTPRQLTHNEGIESGIQWSPDSKSIHFIVHGGSGYIEGSYRDVQGRIYRIDAATAELERLGASFEGSFEDFAVLSDGREIAVGLKSLEKQLYLIEGARATLLPGTEGSYGNLSAALKAPSLLFTHSAITSPTQALLAADPLHPAEAKQLTNFNPVFAERAQPEWRAYSWKSPDGRSVEGVLIFPPGKLNEKHLRMLTLIHGGPTDADGNFFGADWYNWATYAASNGWLVFRPNYRGSVGYGDDFTLAISPKIVSSPGLDILSGVDALVKDGYADADKLAIGGYSYGGYMTNWLITQTDRFKAAVTGAGAVEHAANWGNDDLTHDDAWFLGGKPWENPQIYQAEAALFQFDKVKTPTHLVQGSADVRVSYLEGVTMERALENLKIPHSFLVFPGEGHSLAKDPWHGYIKVREEMKWLEKYVPAEGAKEKAK
jgi:dipeptidyl aminopeptidase/acylaminoacyl peptidase